MDLWENLYMDFCSYILVCVLKVQIDEKVERKFRELAMRRFGYGKGSLSEAAEEAFLMWISSVEGALEFSGDPVGAIDGLLGEVEADAVRLQHEAKKLWSLKVVKDVSDRY